MTALYLYQTLTHRHTFWILGFEALKTILWFSRAWVARPANWIVNNKMIPYGIQPDWGINSLQYFFLPLLPLVTLGLSATLYLAILHVTQDIYLASLALAFSYVYASGGIHLDGLVDTLDALQCHDKDKWVVMKEPYIGALGAYNLNLYQVFFSAGMFYLGILAEHSPHLLPLYLIALTLARLNLLYLVPKALREKDFRQDEIVHEEPPYTESIKRFSHLIFTSPFKYAIGVSILALPLSITPRLVQQEALTLSLIQVLSTLLVILFVNKVVVVRAKKNLGFLSGDVLGYTISLIEIYSLFLTLSLFRLHSQV